MPLDQADYQIETKPDVFSLEGFVAWLEKQPKRKRYTYGDSSSCPNAQFHRATGAQYSAVNAIIDSLLRLSTLAGQIEKIASVRPRTYGAVLSRARALASRS